MSVLHNNNKTEQLLQASISFI